MYNKLAEITRENAECLSCGEIAEILNDEFGLSGDPWEFRYTPDGVDDEIAAGFIEIGDDVIVVWIDGR